MTNNEPKPEASKEIVTARTLKLFAQLREAGHGEVADAFQITLGEIERLQRERDDLYRANVDLATRLAHEPCSCVCTHGVSMKESCRACGGAAVNIVRAVLGDAP